MIRVYSLRGLSFVMCGGGVSVNRGPVVPSDWTTKYFTVPAPVESIETVETIRPTVRWDAKDGSGATLTCEEYDSQKEVLTKDLQYDDEGDGGWSSIDAEYAYKKFEAAWERVTDEVERRTAKPFEVVSLDYDATDIPPYCVPLRLEGACPTEDNFALFRYSPNRFQMCSHMAEQYGFEFVGERAKEGMFWSIPDFGRKDLSFIQVSTTYATSSNNPRLRDVTGIVGTAAECMERHTRNLRTLNQFWQEEAGKMNRAPLAPASAGDLLRIALSLQGKLAEVHSRKETQSAKMDAARLSASLVEKLRGLAVEVKS